MNKRKNIFLIIVLFIIVPSINTQTHRVLTGIDVLQEENFLPLRGKRIGLITNHTGIDRNWNSTIDILHNAKNVNVVSLFSPEHGIRGIADSLLESSVDQQTGLPMYSLYGKTKRPTKEMLEDIELLIFDIQDIGTRFYTYIGTMKNCMEEAAKYGIDFMVLDRPNPITGVMVEGPVLAPEHVFELAGIHSIPIRHGMTAGELALLFKADLKINLTLKVIKMKGWKREMWFDETGLPWVNTSPNVRSLYGATLYPGIGILERTNICTKRGLERPFEMFGAPYINSVELAKEMNKRKVEGVNFIPIKFIPEPSSYGLYVGQLCQGVAIQIYDRNKLNVVRCGMEVISALSSLYPEKFDLERIWHLIRSKKLIAQLKDHVPVAEIIKSWLDDLNKFKSKREKFLIY